MKKFFHLCSICILLFQIAFSSAQVQYPDLNSSLARDEISNQLSNRYMPVIGVWVWNKENLLPDGYKKPINQAGMHSPFNLLILFLRFPDKEVTDDKVYQQVKLAAD